MYKPGEIFSVIEDLANKEYLSGNLTLYSNEISLTHVNKKVKGSEIVGLDTFRGCPHKCLDCYANRMSKIARKDFSSPVPIIKFSGKIHPEKIYRFGTVGDPDVDWSYTSDIVEEMKRLGLGRYFFITKLQSIKGINPEHIKNVQVSVDPLNKKHFFKTLRNITKIKDTVSGVVIRLRTIQTTNRDINRLIKTGIAFAEKNDIPILETKVKFSSKSYLTTLELYGYERIHSKYNVRGSILRKIRPKSLSCDPFAKGTCVGCKICPDNSESKLGRRHARNK